MECVKVEDWAGVDLSNACRLCLGVEENMNDINDYVVNVLEKILNKKILLEFGSKKICNKCNKHIKHTSAFHTACLESYNFWTSYMKSNPITPKNTLLRKHFETLNNFGLLRENIDNFHVDGDATTSKTHFETPNSQGLLREQVDNFNIDTSIEVNEFLSDKNLGKQEEIFEKDNDFEMDDSLFEGTIKYEQVALDSYDSTMQDPIDVKDSICDIYINTQAVENNSNPKTNPTIEENFSFEQLSEEMQLHMLSMRLDKEIGKFGYVGISMIQYNKLVDLMVNNKKLALGSFSTKYEKKMVTLEWDANAKILNSLQGATKTGAEWREVWNLWKTPIRKKITSSSAIKQKMMKYYTSCSLDAKIVELLLETPPSVQKSKTEPNQMETNLPPTTSSQQKLPVVTNVLPQNVPFIIVNDIGPIVQPQSIDASKSTAHLPVLVPKPMTLSETTATAHNTLTLNYFFHEQRQKQQSGNTSRSSETTVTPRNTLALKSHCHDQKQKRQSSNTSRSFDSKTDSIDPTTNESVIEIVHIKAENPTYIHKKKGVIENLSFKEQKDEMERTIKSARFIDAKFKCVMCAIIFKNNESETLHKEKHATSRGLFVCFICTQKFHTVEQLTKHNVTHSVRVRCLLCNSLIKNRLTFKTHIAKHVRNTFTCDDCNVSFEKKRALQIHMNAAHSIESFACNGCDSKFIYYHELLSHSRTHYNDS